MTSIKKVNICEICGNGFPNRIRIEGKTLELHNRKYCLDCNPFGEKRIWRGKKAKRTYDKDGKRILYERTFVCKTCGKKRTQKTRNMECVYCRNSKARIRKRMKAIDYLGGKCIICGYSGFKDALDFHHLDPSKKSFTISSNLSKGWNVLKKEISKCVLMCANHHREYHANRFCLLTDKR